MFQMFDSKHDRLIDFGEFVRSLSIFHPKAPLEDKASFAFQLYNIRQTCYIRFEEANNYLILSEDNIDAIVLKTFEEADSKDHRKIDLEEWRAFVDRYPAVLKNMTLPYLV
ncbi:hypothetical protein RND81_11G174200 [Saponaria officinalis]|uniref:Calcineurin B-like protein n=1 Tax=Saponaria officinalis TaxID=3572 RepID=A0AAW1HPC5_SAPOF